MLLINRNNLYQEYINHNKTNQISDKLNCLFYIQLINLNLLIFINLSSFFLSILTSFMKYMTKMTRPKKGLLVPSLIISLPVLVEMKNWFPILLHPA